jgi:hypothetical protein
MIGSDSSLRSRIIPNRAYYEREPINQLDAMQIDAPAISLTKWNKRIGWIALRLRVSHTHIPTGPLDRPPLLAGNRQVQRNLSVSRFFCQILTLWQQRSCTPFSDSFASFPSAALGERPAICSNGIHDPTIVERPKPRLRLCAVCQTHEGNSDEKQSNTPLPLDTGTVGDLHNRNT